MIFITHLQRANVYWHEGELYDASINRSPTSYLLNPASVAIAHHTGWFNPSGHFQHPLISAIHEVILKSFDDVVRVSAHRHFVFLQNFVKSSLGRIFAKDLRFCEQLLRKIKVNTIAEEGRTWKKGSKSSPLLCNFLRQIQFLNFKIWTSQEACCLSYHFFKYKPNFTKFCTDTKPVSANSLSCMFAMTCTLKDVRSYVGIGPWELTPNLSESDELRWQIAAVTLS